MTRRRNSPRANQRASATDKAPAMNSEHQNNNLKHRTSSNGHSAVLNGASPADDVINGELSANGSSKGDHVACPPSGKIVKIGKKLVPHHYLPKFLADNEYLLNYHRPQLNSFIECFRSMFSLHTETWNIWTHLGGSMLFVAISIYYLFNSVSWGQRFTFFIFFFGAIMCLGCSGIYHTVLCHSEPIYRLFSKLDYCGVILLIMSSWAPWLHYGFYCSLASKLTYTVLVATLGTLCIVVILNDGFSGKEYRPLRAALFVALGLTGVVPGIHYAFVYGVAGQLHMFIWLILMAVIYILGAVIYALRIPERFYPGKFDIWFQSHQIMHVCVVIAALFCYHGASQLADFRIQGTDCVGSIAGSERLADFDQ